MANDNYIPQTTGEHVRPGHEEADFSIRGIVLFVVVLVLSAVLTYIAAGGLLRGFEWWAKSHEAPATPVQQELNNQRTATNGKAQGIKPQPDWYSRAVDEKAIERTFPTPRLQYDDVADMDYFRDSELRRLESTGKDPDGSIHIPVNRAIDLLAQRGLPGVSGAFSEPPLGNLTAVAEAAQRRLNEPKNPAQPKPAQPKPAEQNKPTGAPKP
jgi:hypothetical protein